MNRSPAQPELVQSQRASTASQGTAVGWCLPSETNDQEFQPAAGRTAAAAAAEPVIDEFVTLTSPAAGGGRDRWSRSRRQALQPASAVGSGSSTRNDTTAEDEDDSGDESACDSPALVKPTKRTPEKSASASAADVRAAIDAAPSPAEPSKPDSPAASIEEPPDDNWWESDHSGSDTEDLLEDGEDDTPSLKTLHSTEDAAAGPAAAAATLQTALASIKTELGASQSGTAAADIVDLAQEPAAAANAPARRRSQPSAAAAAAADDSDDGCGTSSAAASANQYAGSFSQYDGRGRSAAAAAPLRAPTAEDKARDAVQIAAAGAPGGRIFTGMSFVLLPDRDGLQIG